jgi:hypothetical protein
VPLRSALLAGCGIQKIELASVVIPLFIAFSVDVSVARETIYT